MKLSIVLLIVFFIGFVVSVNPSPSSAYTPTGSPVFFIGNSAPPLIYISYPDYASFATLTVTLVHEENANGSVVFYATPQTPTIADGPSTSTYTSKVLTYPISFNNSATNNCTLQYTIQYWTKNGTNTFGPDTLEVNAGDLKSYIALQNWPTANAGNKIRVNATLAYEFAQVDVLRCGTQYLQGGTTNVQPSYNLQKDANGTITGVEVNACFKFKVNFPGKSQLKANSSATANYQAFGFSYTLPSQTISRTGNIQFSVTMPSVPYASLDPVTNMAVSPSVRVQSILSNFIIVMLFILSFFLM
jgi:hypothetical protein